MNVIYRNSLKFIKYINYLILYNITIIASINERDI